MFCWKCGAETNPNARFCKACGSLLHPPANTNYSVQSPINQASAVSLYAHKKKPLTAAIIIILAVAALFTAGLLFLPPFFIGDDDPDVHASGKNAERNKISNKSGGFQDDGVLQIELGKPEESGSGTVGVSGGNVTIDDKDSKLNGLSIKIPEGAYTQDIDFTISEVPLNTDFGKDFEPLVPLIRIENGGILADGFLELFVPCEVPEDSEPSAWYIDESTGEMEAIPVLDVSDDGVTLSVRHFSGILVGAEKNTDIRSLGIIDTGFKPGKDDWKFTNRGSAYAPGGHCAGQSMTAMWYYIFRKSEGSLFNKFDNYGWKDYGFETPTIWQDDVMGYRLSTTAQVNLDWSDAKYKDYLASCRRSAKGTYFAFVNTMNKTKRPQFVGIVRKKPEGGYGGHALIAYKVDTALGRIYIADPNYPGDTDRYIEYNEATGFKPYSSAPDRDAADAGDYYSYPEIFFIGISSFMDLTSLNNYFKDFDSRTVGNATWQSRDLKIFTKVTDADGNEKEIEIIDGYAAPAQLKITRFETPYSNSRIELFLHNAKGDRSLGDFGTEMLIDLEPGENYIGIYHKTLTNNGKPKFYDFIWIKVSRDFDFAGEWQGEMTWSVIDMPALADVIAAIPDTGDDAYQREVQSVTGDYNRVLHDRGKTYPATMTVTVSNGTYEADVLENHDIDGELTSYFAFSLADGRLLMDETDESDTIHFIFEQDKTAPQGTDRIKGQLKAHIADDYFSADVVVDFKFDRITR